MWWAGGGAGDYAGESIIVDGIGGCLSVILGNGYACEPVDSSLVMIVGIDVYGVDREDY